MTEGPDPFAKFKAAQREAWATFAPAALFNTIAAAKLVKFAQINAAERVLDLGCGTGVVAVTAARRGAKVRGLDLSPALLEGARQNAMVAKVDIEFVEGDAEALPYPEAAFDVVLSQFGHMFAPRPAIAVQEMLRVLRVDGRIAFSTWPPELFGGKQFPFFARYMPPPPGAEQAPSPALWGDPTAIRERLGTRVTGLLFERATTIVPALSPQHFRSAQETTIGPLMRIVASLAGDPEKLAQLRAEYETMIGEVFEDNSIHMHFLMTRATKLA
jgi:SAM-dependent methyltransferase